MIFYSFHSSNMVVSTEYYDMLIEKKIKVQKRIEALVREIEIEVKERIEVKKIIEALVRKIEIEEKRIADDHDMLRKYRLEKKRIADDHAMLLKDLLEEKRVANALVRMIEIEKKRIADSLFLEEKREELCCMFKLRDDEKRCFNEHFEKVQLLNKLFMAQHNCRRLKEQIHTIETAT